MADRPIIFSAPMVRALLAGTKTQTRRILKPQPPEGYVYTGVHYASYEPSSWFFNGPRSGHKVRQAYDEGDLLWVREGWQAPAMDDHLSPRDMPPGLARRYLADGAEVVGFGADTVRQPIGAAGRGRPSIHMPRWASRLTLTVSEVRVQQLQDISEEDARAEGAPALLMDDEGGFYEHGDGLHRVGFAGLWAHLHGPASWDASPWVAAISFEATPANIDSLPEMGCLVPQAAPSTNEGLTDDR